MTNEQEVLYERVINNDDLIQDTKYVVFKRPTLDQLLIDLKDSLTPAVGAALNTFLEQVVEDGVVIRRQDMIAPPVFDQYANTYRAMSEVLAEHGEEATAQRLMGVSSYFHDQAVLSWGADRKLPD